ncbi:hypothetical protein SAMN02745227_01084 [Anaerobranca californiensis DSM 14826]|jgi:primosomal protein N'|uniref:Uncharacterized protein n=1 Tax=Anaerobranca californiensis DSM 14826 TaxID=1120989 RepID=A0A1M6NA55_9FIRM|nr:hypothetical protein [Anaerobranca californiensis]SHJ92573.1 hypothetical protein SAMN02745227_01084 [Anaerobranca californiensis DSM 14826]
MEYKRMLSEDSGFTVKCPFCQEYLTTDEIREEQCFHCGSELPTELFVKEQ